MSVQFSNTSTRRGLVQIYEKACGFNYGDVSGDSERLATFTAEANLAIDSVLGFMFPLGGRWQLDDSNHTDYPIISTNLISGRRSYAFTTDEDGNEVLDIHRVVVAGPDGILRDITPVDQQTPNNANSDTSGFVDGQDLTGTPTKYDKTANGIFLDRIPNYNMRLNEEGVAGLKIYVNREASYFTTSDTTKKVGFAKLFHEYFALRPAQSYIMVNGTNDDYTKITNKVEKMEQAIKNYYGNREKDVKKGMRALIHNTK